MRITAISDIHGSLVPIESTDLLVICGDWSPLKIQQHGYFMKQWINDNLLPWFSEIEADKIVFIAGNHDFICDESFLEIPMIDAPSISFKKDILNPLLKKHNLFKKVSYLDNNYIDYNGYKIYGCPNVEGCYGWAFSAAEITEIYRSIPKCDILLTHQPPLIGSVGCVKQKNIERDFGSYSLKNVILNKKPKYVFCGHIHEGNHEKHLLKHSNNKETQIFNVSLKNEEYNIAYKPLIIDTDE